MLESFVMPESTETDKMQINKPLSPVAFSTPSAFQGLDQQGEHNFSAGLELQLQFEKLQLEEKSLS